MTSAMNSMASRDVKSDLSVAVTVELLLEGLEQHINFIFAIAYCANYFF
jgi:hypothetical protein